MADFWGGFGKGFAPAFEKAWESSEKRRSEQRKLQREAAKSKNINMANALKAFEQVTQAGGDPDSLLPTGAFMGKGMVPADWVKSASEADLLSVSGKATPIVSELQRVRTQREVADTAQDSSRAKKWTDVLTGNLNIPEEMKETYPEGGLRRDRLVAASEDFTSTLSKSSQERLAERAEPADKLRKEIELYSGSPIRSFYDLTPQEQAFEATDRGFERMHKLRDALSGYIDRYKAPLTTDPLKVVEKSHLKESIAKNQSKIKEGGLSDAQLAKAQKDTRGLRIRLASLEGETTFTVEKLERAIASYDDKEAKGEDMAKAVWDVGRTQATKNIKEFERLIRPHKFSNGKTEDEIWFGEGDNRESLYEKTYFKKVYLTNPDGSKNESASYMDVKPSFMPWLTTWKTTIPQFYGDKEFIAMNPSGAERSILYLPEQFDTPDDEDPGVGEDVDVAPEKGVVVGVPGYRDFWKEREHVSELGRKERERTRGKYNVGPDGNIEVPAAPAPAPQKVFEETGDLRSVPRREERESVLAPRRQKVPMEKGDFEAAARRSLQDKKVFNAVFAKIPTEEERRQLRDELRAVGDDEEKALRIMMRVMKNLEGK